MFEDIPLDLRHRPIQKKLKFPLEWRLTPERKDALVEARTQAYLIDQAKTADGTIVDGKHMIESALPPVKVEEPARARSGQGHQAR